MRSSPAVHAFFLLAAMTAAWRAAAAAPVPLTSELPLTNDDVRSLRSQLDPEEFLRTIDFIATLRVFEDDASTPSRPTFYIAPFFSADRSQEVIGSQIIATDVLAYLEVLDALLAEVDGSHRYLDRLEAVRVNLLAIAAELVSAAGQLAPDASEPLLTYATQSNPYQQEIELVAGRIRAAMNELPSVLRRAIAAELLRCLDALEIALTSSERFRALTDPIGFVLLGETKLRAKVATLFFGIRHARFISGMTLEHTRLLDNYRRLRPDVDLRALPIQVLRVLPVSSAVADGGLFGHTVEAPEMIRGVNVSTGSVCGLTATCTVIIEYTEIGARSALLSTRGAAILPAQFVGDVAVSPTALAVRTTCDTAALHQRLVLRFGLGLLGDREVLHALAIPQVCSTATGNAAQASAAVLLGSTYRNLFFDSAHVSTAQARQLPAEISRILANVDDVVGVIGIVGTLLQVLGPSQGVLERFARTYYSRLEARFPPELLAGIVVNSTSTPETVRFDFDGIAIACWKRAADGSSYLSACPDRPPEPPDIQWSTAATLEERSCLPIPDLNGCAAAIQSRPPDTAGYLWVDS